MAEVVQQAVVAVFGHSKSPPQEYALARRVGSVLGANGYMIVNGGYSRTGTLVDLALVWELLNKKLLSDRPPLR